MSDYTLLVVFLVLLSLAAGMVFFRRKFKNDVVFDSEPIDYTITMWAERSGVPNSGPESLAQGPHKITAEYYVTFQAESVEQQRQLRGDYAQPAQADFHSRITPMLGEFNIGALRFEPTDEIEQ